MKGENTNTEPPSPCPKCKKEMRTRIEREDGVSIFCSDCGWMERDWDNVKWKVKICRQCGQVPKTKVVHGMPDDKTLNFTSMLWTCCGETYPVWSNEVVFWCHMYLARVNKYVEG